MRQRIDITEARGGHEDPRPSTCARSRTRNGHCCRGPTFVKAFCARMPTTSGSTAARSSKSSSSSTSARRCRRSRRPAARAEVAGSGPARQAAAGTPSGSASPSWPIVLIGPVRPSAARDNNNSGPAGSRRRRPKNGATTTTTSASGSRPRERADGEVVPSGQLYVCLLDASGKRVLDGVSAARRSDASSAPRLRLSLGNGAARARRQRAAAAAGVLDGPLGYEVTRDRCPAHHAQARPRGRAAHERARRASSSPARRCSRAA